MELVVQTASEETLAAALEAGVAAVAVRLSPGLEPELLSGWGNWQAAARRRGARLFLLWDWLVGEADFAGAVEFLGALAELRPDGLVLRDLGLAQEARQRYPQLPLHAAANFGAHNSLGLKVAQSLGFSRAVLAGPVSLKDLGLIRRQTSVALEVTLPPGCAGFPGLCLLPEYLGVCCPCPWGFGPEEDPAKVILAALELLAGLGSLGVEAVQLNGDFFSGESLIRLLDLCQAVLGASTAERPRVMAAAREVVTAFGAHFQMRPGTMESCPPGPRPPALAAPPAQPRRGPVWLEVRDYQEAAALAPEWREPLILTLNAENYRAFLPELRRWTPRRLVWRLPPLIRESALSFYQKAAETLWQGGYSRFVAGDWGGVALIQALGGEVYGDQSLGIRNSRALKSARLLGVIKACLPPGAGPESWEALATAGPPGSLWGYLYHFPPLGVYPRASSSLPPPLVIKGEKLRWMGDGDLLLLCRRFPEQLENFSDWFQRRRVAPLVAALPRSGLQRGRLPSGLLPPAPRYSRGTAT
jgi:collagenase-like PrtC family protease